MQKTFSIREALTFGLNTVKGRLLFFVGLTVIPFVVSWVFQLLSGMLSTFGQNLSQSDSFLANTAPLLSVASLVVTIASVVISILLSVGTAKIQLETVDGQLPDFKELFSEKQLVARAFLAMVISGVLTTLGFMVLIIPGIFLAMLYQFFMYVVVDSGHGGFTALKESARITKGARVKLVLFAICMALINFVGLALLGIGALFTIPVTTVAHVYIYRKLKEQTERIG